MDGGVSIVDADQCTLYDAGAAAENIVLAAYALGLGASFIKSYPEAAVKTVLGLPDRCRTELIISLGYPTPNEPRPVKKTPQGKLTYYNKYGQKENVTNTWSGNKPSTPEKYLFDYAVFLVTAARGVTSEPRHYGAIRLLDAISKITGLYSTTNSLEPDKFLLEEKSKIDTKLNTAMVSEEEFMKFIDTLVEDFTNELMKRPAK